MGRRERESGRARERDRGGGRERDRERGVKERDRDRAAQLVSHEPNWALKNPKFRTGSLYFDHFNMFVNTCFGTALRICLDIFSRYHRS